MQYDRDAFEADMKALGLTRHTLAARINVDPVTVWRWLRGALPVPGVVRELMTALVALDKQRRFSAWQADKLKRRAT